MPKCSISEWTRFQDISYQLAPRDLPVPPVQFHSLVSLTTLSSCCPSKFISKQLSRSHHCSVLYKSDRLFCWHYPAIQPYQRTTRCLSHYTSVWATVRVGHRKRHSRKIRERFFACGVVVRSCRGGEYAKTKWVSASVESKQAQDYSNLPSFGHW